MLKKSLLSLAVSASVLGLAGCNISSTTDNAGATPELQLQQQAAIAAYGHYPLFDPVNAVLPLGNDLIFAAAASTDGTASVGNDGGNPVLNALNDVDGGISTLAPIDFAVSGAINPATLVKGSTVHLVKLPSKAEVATWDFPDLVQEDGTGYNIAGAGEDFEALSPLNYEPLDVSQLGALLSAENYESATALAKVGGNVAKLQALQASAVNGEYTVSALSMDGGTNNAIRITPTTPLASASKYIVIITSGVTDADGEALKPSPDYAQIKAAAGGENAEETAKLASSSLVAVSAAINGWEGIAAAATGANPAAVGFDPATVVVSSAFTTGNPTMVLKSMAYPGYWAESAVALDNPTVAAGLIQLAVGNGLASQAQADGIKAVAEGAGLTADEATVFTAGYLVSGALTNDSGNGAPVNSPRARDYAFISDVTVAPSVTVDQVPLFALNSSTEALGGKKVLISQGAIELPQYTTTLTDAEAVSSWQGNTAAGAVLDVLAGNDLGTTPPQDTDGTYNVTYRFPFAAEQRTAVVPLMFIEPTVTAKAGAYAALGAVDSGCTKPAEGWPVVIYQHGFTVHRAGTLLMGTQLAQNTCSVVVAMDLPHHGIAPLSTDRNGADVTNSVLGLTVTYNSDTAAVAPFAAAVNTIVTADPDSLLADLAERHEGLYLDATNSVKPMTWGDTKAGKSGDFFIQLTNFQRTRDNYRQAVMDLLNLNATLASIDIDGDDAADLDTDNVTFVGHSLGAITGTNFVAVNNDATVQLASAISGGVLPKIKSAVLATPGGGLTKLLENSASISPAILAGLSAAAGIAPGDTSFESFMTVLQNTVDSADPMNFIADLSATGSSATNTMLIEMIGGGAISQTDIDAETLPDALVALGVYPADLVVPNNAQTSSQDTAVVTLAGTDSMIELLGSTEISSAGANQVESYPVTKFNQGTHGTFSSADSVAVFTEMVTEAATFVDSDGAAISVANSAILGTVE